MACKTSSLGVYKKILDKLNDLKSNSHNGNFKLHYFIPEDFSVNGELPSQILKADVFNAFKLWENFFNKLYTKNGFHQDSLKLSFNQVAKIEDADFIINTSSLSSNTKRADVSKSEDEVVTLTLNKNLEYNLPNTRGSVYALSTLVHYIGRALGFTSSSANSVNNSVFLLHDFDAYNKTSRLESFQLEKFDYLDRYADLLGEMDCVYGANNHQQIIYGCNDPNATNYVQGATRFEKCIYTEEAANINIVKGRIDTRSTRSSEYSRFNITEDVTNFVQLSPSGITYIDNWSENTNEVFYNNIVTSFVIEEDETVNRFVCHIDNTGYLYCHDRFGNPLSPIDSENNTQVIFPSPTAEELLSSTASVFNPLIVTTADENLSDQRVILGNTGRNGFRILRRLKSSLKNYYADGEIIVDCNVGDDSVGNYLIGGSNPASATAYGQLLVSSFLQLNEGSNYYEKSIDASNTLEFNNSITSEDSSNCKIINAEFAKSTISNIKHAAYTFSSNNNGTFTSILGGSSGMHEFTNPGWSSKNAHLSIVVLSENFSHYYVVATHISRILRNQDLSTSNIYYPSAYYRDANGNKHFRTWSQAGITSTGITPPIPAAESYDNKVIIRSFAEVLKGYNTIDSFINNKFSESTKEFSEASGNDTDYLSTLENVPSTMSLKPYKYVSGLNVHSGANTNPEISDIHTNYQGTLLSYYVLGCKHGFLLLSYAPNLALFLNFDDGGTASMVPGGNWFYQLPDGNNPIQEAGGYTPVSMEFSEYNNYLYMIVKNPEDSSDKYLCRYPLHSMADDGLALSSAALMIESPFHNNAQKVIRTKDNSILFIAGNEYLQITDADKDYVGREQFTNPVVHIFNTGLSIIPTSSSHLVNLNEHVAGQSNSVFHLDTIDPEELDFSGLGFAVTIMLFGKILNLDQAANADLTLDDQYAYGSTVIDAMYYSESVREALDRNKFLNTNARNLVTLPKAKIATDTINTPVLYAYPDLTRLVSDQLYQTSGNNIIIIADQDGTVVETTHGLIGSAPLCYEFVKCWHCSNPETTYLFLSVGKDGFSKVLRYKTYRVLEENLDGGGSGSGWVSTTFQSMPGAIEGTSLIWEDNSRAGSKPKFINGFEIINTANYSWILTTVFHNDSSKDIVLYAYKYTSAGIEEPVKTILKANSGTMSNDYYSYCTFAYRGGVSRLAVATHANYISDHGTNAILTEGEFNVDTGEYIFTILHSDFVANPFTVNSTGGTPITLSLNTIFDLIYSESGTVLYALYGTYNTKGIVPYNGSDNTDVGKNRIFKYNINGRNPSSASPLANNIPGVPTSFVPLGYNTSNFGIAVSYLNQNDYTGIPTEDPTLVVISNSDQYANSVIDENSITHVVAEASEPVIDISMRSARIGDVITIGSVSAGGAKGGQGSGSGTGVVSGPGIGGPGGGGEPLEPTPDEPGSGSNSLFGCTNPNAYNYGGPNIQNMQWFGPPVNEWVNHNNANAFLNIEGCLYYTCPDGTNAFEDNACGLCWASQTIADAATAFGTGPCTFCTDPGASNYAEDLYNLCLDQEFNDFTLTYAGPYQYDLTAQASGYSQECYQADQFLNTTPGTFAGTITGINAALYPLDDDANGTCEYIIGCTNPSACNYDPAAYIESNNSCDFADTACNCDGSFNFATSNLLGILVPGGTSYCGCTPSGNSNGFGGTGIVSPPWFNTPGNFGQIAGTPIYPGGPNYDADSGYYLPAESANSTYATDLVGYCGCGGTATGNLQGYLSLYNNFYGGSGVRHSKFSDAACHCDGTRSLASAPDYFHPDDAVIQTYAANGKYCDCDGNSVSHGCDEHCLYKESSSPCGCPTAELVPQPDGTTSNFKIPDSYNTTDPTQTMYCNCSNGTLTPSNIAYDDSDGDGLGDPNIYIHYCGDTPPDGYVDNNGDENPATACDAALVEGYPGGFDASDYAYLDSTGTGVDNTAFILPTIGVPTAPMNTQVANAGGFYANDPTMAQPIGLGEDGVSYQDTNGTCAGTVMRGICGGYADLQPLINAGLVTISDDGQWAAAQGGVAVPGGSGAVLFGTYFLQQDANYQATGENAGCCTGTFKGGDGLCYATVEELPVQACDGTWVPPQFEEATQATPCGLCSLSQFMYGYNNDNYNPFGGAVNFSDVYNKLNDEEVYDCHQLCGNIEDLQDSHPGLCSCETVSFTTLAGTNTFPQFEYLDECLVCGGQNACITDGCTDPASINTHPCIAPDGTIDTTIEGCEGITTVNDDGSCLYPGTIDFDTVTDTGVIQNLVMSSAWFLPYNTEEIDFGGSYNIDVIQDTYEGEFGQVIINRDNPDWTTKCQVISRSNPYLVLGHPALNAENVFGAQLTNLSGNQIDFENVVEGTPTLFDTEIFLENQGLSGNFNLTSWYYFRIKGYDEDTTDGIRFAINNTLQGTNGNEINFDSIITSSDQLKQNVYQIRDAYGNMLVPAFYEAFGSANDIGNLQSGQAGTVQASDSPGDSAPLYYVYTAQTNSDVNMLFDFTPYIYVEIYGCTDSAACNYDETANTDDGSCYYEGEVNLLGEFLNCDGQIVGCMDPVAKNYNASAGVDGGNCVYWDTSTQLVCLDPSAHEYSYWCTHPDNPSGCDEDGMPIPFIDDVANQWIDYVAGDSCTLCEHPDCIECTTGAIGEIIPKCCDPSALNYYSGNLLQCEECVFSSFANPQAPCEYASVEYENEFLNQDCTDCIIYEIQTSSTEFSLTQQQLDEFRYVIYDSKGDVVLSSEEQRSHLLSQASVSPYEVVPMAPGMGYPATSTLYNSNSLSIRIIEDISTLADGCYLFLPIGFSAGEVWKHTKLTLKLGNQVKHTLVSGASSSANPFGAIGLNIGVGTCNAGCGNSPSEYNPPTCESLAVLDDDGILDMKLILNLSEVEDADAYEGLKVLVVDIDSGKELAELGSTENAHLIPGTSYAETFIITQPTTIGVKVVNSSNIQYPVSYEIIANEKNVILSKRLSQ